MPSKDVMIKACIGLVLANCFLIFALATNVKILKIIGIGYLIEESLHHVHQTKKYIGEITEEASR